MMIKTVMIFILAFFNWDANAQCKSGAISYFDSTGEVVENETQDLNFQLSNELNVIRLASLNLTKFINPYRTPISFNSEIDSNEFFNLRMNESYCNSCMLESIEITDSVDVNNDGVKEVVLLRKGACSSAPAVPIQCCGVGIISVSASQYEIWDSVTKTLLFEIRNQFSFSEALTVNVGYTDSYRFDFEINKKGIVRLSNHRGNESEYEMGMYRFDAKTNRFLLE